MTALGASQDKPVELVRAAAEHAAGPLAGDPGLLGLPSFIVGTVTIALVFIGVVPAGTTGAALPTILAATAIGMFIAAIWAAAIGHSAVAGINGTFAGVEGEFRFGLDRILDGIAVLLSRDDVRSAIP